ncbi:MAG TPA: Tat pathway signal sequence domain protein, partial [Chloroflexota bacterium]|nr:Tat pathway signal sequence domain protein [Chloroflexota bacterium]
MTAPLARRLARRTDRRIALATGMGALGGAAASLAGGRVGAAPGRTGGGDSGGGPDGGPFAGYGPLVPDRSARRVLDLPEGFRYRVLIERGDALSNGDPRPGQADGMAA